MKKMEIFEKLNFTSLLLSAFFTGLFGTQFLITYNELYLKITTFFTGVLFLTLFSMIIWLIIGIWTND